MADYNATVGEVNEEHFRADGNIKRFQASSDAEAIEKTEKWLKSVRPVVTRATHSRLQEELSSMKRRLVGIWPLEEFLREVH